MTLGETDRGKDALQLDLKIAILDSGTLGGDLDFSLFERFGRVEIYGKTDAYQVRFRIADADVIIVNKIRLDAQNLSRARRLKLICVTATGFDNIDTAYCKIHGIAVCNVRGYSTYSVAQVTAAMVLSLANNLPVFDEYVKDGRYTESGVQNCLTPVFHELRGKTWGIAGLGAIGKRVSEIAKALGCRVAAFKRRNDPLYECVSLETLCEKSDIISVHLPLTDATHGIISADMIARMRRGAIVVNAARGAVVDEAALCAAVRAGRLGGLGVDVYSEEPMAADSPYRDIIGYDNVIFTPHMAWGAYEARIRCMEEIAENIEVFFRGGRRNRVE